MEDNLSCDCCGEEVERRMTYQLNGSTICWRCLSDDIIGDDWTEPTDTEIDRARARMAHLLGPEFVAECEAGIVDPLVKPRK